MNAHVLPATLTDANRPIRLRFDSRTDIPDDLLMVQHVSGSETMFGGLEYVLLCVSTRAGQQLKHIIASPVAIQFVTDTGALRSVCGIVAEASEGQSDGGLATYQLVIRDALFLLEKTCNTRVFRDASEIDITETLIREWRTTNAVIGACLDVDLSNLKSYPKRAMTMQYNESTAKFLRRLWKRRGIASFIQSGTTIGARQSDSPIHTLVLFDNVMRLDKNAAGDIRFHRDDATETSDTISAWHAVRALSAGSISRSSWDFVTGRALHRHEELLSNQGILGRQISAGLNHYLIDSPHTGNDTNDYRDLAVSRIQHLEYASKFFQGEGSVRAMCVGQWNRITGHPELDKHPEAERDFVVTELQIEASNNLPKALDERVRRLFALNHWYPGQGALDQASTERGVRYTNRFTCVRRGIPIMPAYDPRVDLPRTEIQYAAVVGPVNEEIYCDSLGRVKIRFPGCRPEDHAHAQGAGASDSDRDSAWVPVLTPWAGSQYGSISLPRVGHQVLCAFVGGDPDKPLIIGRAHGGRTPPTSFSRRSQLPGDRYLSGIVSREGASVRYNQLRMDDTPGQISAQLASEHGHSQLNLGYLVHPRCEGRAEARGEGFELATNDSGAIRTAKSLLLTAWKRLDVCGDQLGSEEHLALMQDCLDLFKSLGQYAAQHGGMAADPAPQEGLKANLDAADKEGHPTLSLTAPAGIAFSTPKTIVTYAGVNLDTIAQQHLQLTCGQRCNLHAGKGISLFSHMDGITQVAHKGKFLMQSQHDDMQLDAAKDLKITAGKRVIVMAEEEVTFIVSGGAYLTLKGKTVEIGAPGAITIKTDGHHWCGPASGKTELPTFDAGEFVRTPRLLRATDGKPVEGMQVHVEREGDSPLSGKTNGAGESQEITADHLQQLKATFFKPSK
jgi:type VI secretion system secreted protein VgrG